MTTLRTQNLSWQAAGQAILDGLTLDFPANQVSGIIGPNGSGKSSLLRAIYGAVKPAFGQVLLDGADIAGWAARRRARHIAVVLQEFPAEFDLTVEQIVTLGRTPHRQLLDFTADDAGGHVTHALERTHTTAFRHRRFETLSGGEKQRVLIARALAQEPRLLILDEPTNHLDIRHQLEVLALLRNLGVTIITSLHDLNLAARYCDKLFALQAGRLMKAGTPTEVLTPALIADVFGVAARVDRHPEAMHPQIMFDDPALPAWKPSTEKQPALRLVTSA